MSHPDMNQFPQPQLQTPNQTMIYYSRPSLSNPIPTQLWPPPPWVTSPPPTLPPPSSSVNSPRRTRSSQKPKEQLPKQPKEQLLKQPKEQLLKQPEQQFLKPPEQQMPIQPEQQCPKTCLQEFTQKLKIPLPHYTAEIVGPQNRLRFISTVTVNGEKFTSPNTFRTRKAAEKDIAKIALMHLSQKKIEEDLPQDISLSPEEIVSYKSFLNEVGLVFCKSILHEFAAKADMEYPSYNTHNPNPSVPLFVSSLVFNGASYTESGKNKKEAEQLLACAVITSFLDVPKMGKILSNVINSKRKQYDAVQKLSHPSIITASPINTTHSSPIVPAKVIEAPTIVDTLPTTVSYSEASVVPVSNVPPVHEFSVQKPDNAIQATNLVEPAFSEVARLPIEFVHPISEATGPSTSKKRRKNKNKANKRLCTLDTELPVANVALNQAPPFSTAQ